MNCHSRPSDQGGRKPLPAFPLGGGPHNRPISSNATPVPAAGGLFRLNYRKASVGTTAKPGAYRLCRLEVFVNDLDMHLVRVGLRVRLCFGNNEFDCFGICHGHLAFDTG